LIDHRQHQLLRGASREFLCNVHQAVDAKQVAVEVGGFGHSVCVKEQHFARAWNEAVFR
jgi:hypothetical protein